MEKIRVTVLGLVGLATVWLFLGVSFDSQNPAAAGGTRFAGHDSWQRKAKMPEPRKFEAAFPIDGRIYCVTSGDDTGTDGGRIYEYWPANETWTKKRAVTVARHSSGFGTVNGRIYSIGGLLEGRQPAGQPSLTGALEEYDPKTDKWRQRSALPRPRLFAVGAGANGKLYAIGGWRRPTGACSIRRLWTSMTQSSTAGLPKPISLSRRVPTGWQSRTKRFT